MDKFEKISKTVKKTSLKIREPKTDYQVNSTNPMSMTNREAIEMISKAKLLVKEKYDADVSYEDRQLITTG